MKNLVNAQIQRCREDPPNSLRRVRGAQDVSLDSLRCFIRVVGSAVQSTRERSSQAGAQRFRALAGVWS